MITEESKSYKNACLFNEPITADARVCFFNFWFLASFYTVIFRHLLKCLTSVNNLTFPLALCRKQGALLFSKFCALWSAWVWHWLLWDVLEHMQHCVQTNCNLIVYFASFFPKIRNFIADTIWIPLSHWRGKELIKSRIVNQAENTIWKSLLNRRQVAVLKLW